MRTALLLVAALAAEPAAPERVTFDEAVRRALARAPAARVAADEIARVDGLLAQARSGSLPQLAASGTWTRLDHARVLSTPGQGERLVTPESQRQATATLSLPLVTPSRWASWVVAARSLDLARVSAEDVRRQVALAAARSYLAVIAGSRAVEVGRSAVELARVRVEFSRARLAAGVGNALDAARAEQVLASNEALLEVARTGLARAREALGVAVGGDAPLDAAGDPELAAPPPDAGSGEERRADVAAARARLEAVGAAARWSWADWLPSLVATAQGIHQSPAVAPAQPEGWQVQLVLSLPLLEGGLRTGQLREREALERQAGTLLEATLRQARSEVRVAAEAVRHQEAALSAARRAAEEARTVLRLTGRAYEAGAANSLELTDAQTRARDVELASVIAEDAVRQGRLDLLAAVGLFP